MLLMSLGKDIGIECVEMKPHISSSSQLGSQHRDGFVGGTKCTRIIGFNKAFSHHHTLMDVFKCSVLLNIPLLCEHCMAGSEGHAAHIPVAFPNSLFMCVFGRSSDDCWSFHTNSVQNFTLLWDHSVCDSHAIPDLSRIKCQAWDL